MRRGRLVVVAVIVALAGVLAMWLLRERPGDTEPDQGSARGPGLAPSLPQPGEQRGAHALAWLWQRGVDGRRIAGRVVHAGRPVAKAIVRLTTEELRIGEWALAELETDEDGRFDFGTRPATRYQVVAQAEGLVAAGVVVELRTRDPRPAPDDVTIELRDCELVITGTVRDAAGGIIAGARIRAASRSDAFAGVLTDEQGNYKLCLLAGPAHVEAAADGYGTALDHARGRSAARVDFALSPEIAIAGRVVDGAGRPVGRAVVVAETDGHDPGALTESAADGAFLLEGLIAGTYRVVARDDDRAAEKEVTLTTAGATADLVLALEARATLAGRVVLGGRPAGDATVMIGSTDEKWMLGSAITHADGRFSIPGLPRGPVQIMVEKHKLVSPDPTIDLAQVSQVELVCERQATLSGRVVRGGKPVARAEVHLYQEWKRPHTTRSDDDGTFEMEGVAAASYDIVAASLAEGATMARRPIAVGAQDIAGLVLDLDLTASIAGRVVDTSGAPVGGVMVYFDREDVEDMMRGAEAADTTAPDGTFLVAGLAGGTYRPQVRRQDARLGPYPPARGRRFPAVEVAGASPHVTGVELAVSAADLTISGRTERRGEPVAGVEIFAYSPKSGGEGNARSGPDGSFVIEGLAAGPYRLMVHHAGDLSLDVEAGARDVVVELPEVGKIEGVVSGFRTAPDVMVSGSSMMREATVEDMRFAIEVPVGTYVVSASASSGEHATARTTVVAGQVSRVALKASATATITGVAVDVRTRAPVAGAYCRWMLGEGALNRPVVTDAAGAFSFPVPAGKVLVDCHGVRTRLMVAREVSVDIAPGASAHVTVEVLRGRGRQAGEIGVELESVPPDAHRIMALRGGAASSGLRAGDLLRAVDGLPVAGMQSHVVVTLMVDRDVGTAAKLTVEREGAELAFDVPVEPRRPEPDVE
jgi:Carboxypeptidase regulatory-like domain